MYLSQIAIENFRCFGEGSQRFELRLKPGLTALVGENDSGKTAVIDALRFALGTTDQEWYRLEDTDFREGATSREIRIVCKFGGLSAQDKRAFLEYLTYGEDSGNEPVFFVNWNVKDTGEVRRGRPYRRPEVHSGKDGDGPTIVPEVRELLRAIYLRPLRDAEQALSAGRGSRLSQVLRHSEEVKEGNCFDPKRLLSEQQLSVLEIGKLLDELLQEQQAIKGTRTEIDEHLTSLSLASEDITSSIKVSGAAEKDDVRLRQLLEKLDLVLQGAGKLGLGSDNLLFMACELLLLAREEEGSRLLLIEEPEAHLHAQRQLQVMRYMQKQAKEKGIQIIVTTHSPNLASAIELNNLVMIHSRRAFSMAEGQTRLEASDYRFLERFLDVTKANLFFARGVMIVEGDAENILLPTLARLIGCDFTEHGVSIVNVGGVGLRRYARIFQRKGVTDEEEDKQLDIPIACVTDMDVMPDCAPGILEKVKAGEGFPATSKRRWRAKSDFDGQTALEEHRNQKADKASGQRVKTFVSDEWTLEYDMALGPKDENGSFTGGIAEDVFVAACLAQNDDGINSGKKCPAVLTRSAMEEFAKLRGSSKENDGCTSEEVLASKVYATFTKSTVSKAVTAQYLAERLKWKHDKHGLTSDDLRNLLPKYLTEAIDHVTPSRDNADAAPNEEVTDHD